MKKRKKAALYDPYLDVLGGGEKHILSILRVLAEHDYESYVFWDHDLSSQITDKLNLTIPGLSFIPNIFSHGSPLEKLLALKQFDILLYVTDGSYFFSSAKKTIIFCMVPNHKLYQKNLLNNLKTKNARFISNSRFTQEQLRKWDIQSGVIYPFIDTDLLEQGKHPKKKESYILSVGRFFRHLHTKRHDVIIDTFMRFHSLHPEFKLILAGGMKQEDQEYVAELQSIAYNKPIEIRTNISREELLDLYAKAYSYWHFAGFNIDEQKHPENVEHLGMTPLEAMATGTPVFCYKAGGPKEIISHGKNGFLFSSIDELIVLMNTIYSDASLFSRIQSNGYQYVKDNFGYESFKTLVLKTLL